MKNDSKFILSAFFLWRIFLELARLIGERLVPLRTGYLGLSPWSNFDGVHYLSIAKIGYQGFEQAFFPGYPLAIKIIGSIINLPLNNQNLAFLVASLLISNLSILISLFLLFELVKEEFNNQAAKETIIFLLVFPVSFYFISSYSESLFLLIILSSFYLVKKRKWFFASLTGTLASFTRLVGLFLIPSLIFLKGSTKKAITLLIALGTASYMLYLKLNYNDFLSFFHAQPAFGAGRSGGDIILLPQVIYRYLKIFITVPASNYDWWIAAFEFITVFSVMTVLTLATIKKALNSSYLIYSWLALLTPTLTGTFSSMPRYILTIFPIFIILSNIKEKKLKIVLALGATSLLLILTALFTRGYFVS